MRLKKPLLGKADKGKGASFAEQIMKKKAWVPGPQYQKLTEWSALRPTGCSKFTKSARYTIAGEIERRSKSKEKSSPGANQYDNTKAWRATTKFKKTLGNYKQTDVVVSCAAEAQNMYGETPFNKYDPVALEQIRPVPRRCKIGGLARWRADEQDSFPSPNEYNVVRAVARSQWASKQPALSKAPRRDYFQE